MATLFPSLFAEIVKFANKKAVPFLVFNTVHRAMTTLSQIDHSIEIYLNQLNDMKIFPNRKTVKFSGRTVSKKVTDTFYAAKADSYMGPTLGGSCGWLQGHYRIIADQILTINVILTNRSFKIVD
uniref:Uncharacterized protein n=1 Tax=Fusarium oxysporum (strain Fo5176) TaxID=660025 RepID=A0A0C4BKS6_FUSOF